jgi:non-heme chloroperoxidase
MSFFGQQGFRVIEHDRRGHGRSTQTWDGNEMDTYADDLAALTEKLDLKNAIHVGHSTGGGEVARYIGRHGSKRVGMAVLISAVPPLMLKTDKNPAGAPMPASTGCEPNLSKIDLNFTRILRSRSTGTTGPAPGFQKASGSTGGCRECWEE